MCYIFFRVFYDPELAFRFMKKFLNVHVGQGVLNNIVYKKGTEFNECKRSFVDTTESGGFYHCTAHCTDLDSFTESIKPNKLSFAELYSLIKSNNCADTCETTADTLQHIIDTVDFVDIPQSALFLQINFFNAVIIERNDWKKIPLSFLDCIM